MKIELLNNTNETILINEIGIRINPNDKYKINDFNEYEILTKNDNIQIKIDNSELIVYIDDIEQEHAYACELFKPVNIVNMADDKYIISTNEPNPILYRIWFNINNYISYIYNLNLKYWVSTSKMNIKFGYNGKVRSRYLNFDGGLVQSWKVGYPFPRNILITSLTFNNINSNPSGKICLRKNNIKSNLYTFDINNKMMIVDNIDLTMDKDDFLQLYIYKANIKNPLVSIEYVWRY